ncbi:MAG TPA: serine/threonine-protein kinase [Streptosporangiaceae bacterium]|nr:serine/threonine-protein kinase [Streptosporangiaceae bacterium]
MRERTERTGADPADPADHNGPADAAVPAGPAGRAAPLRPGDPARIGAYELLGKLGEGGMGAVYLGRDGEGRLVAIKVIRPELAANASFRNRFRDEVRNAQRVASFCTAQVLEHGEEDDRPYLVTEYVDGRPLDEYIETEGALPPGTLHGVAVGVAAALTAIHAAGLVHRDLKPANVLLSVSGPRVIDFGIARAADATAQHTKAGFLVGSPGWMAPEQVLRGEISTAVDIFAWGTLVAFAGTGRRPYGTGPVIALAARAEHGEPDLAGLPEALRAIVRRALAADPGQRPSAQQLLLSLVGGTERPADEPARGPSDAQAAADREISRTWRAQPPALPPPDMASPGMASPGMASASPPTPTPTPAPGSSHLFSAPALSPSPPGAPRAGPMSGAGYPPSYPPSYPPPGPAPGMASGPGPGPGPGTMPGAIAGPAPGSPTHAMSYGGQPPPGARASRRRRRVRGCLFTGVGLVVAVFAALLIIGYLTQPSDGELGRPAKDGQFTFVVRGPATCGAAARVAGITPSKGKLCQVPFSVTNTGTKRRTLAPGYQELHDANGNYRSGAILLRGDARARNRVAPQLLSPGSTFSGVVLFDVPPGFQPTSVVLYDDSTSNGVRVPAS